MVFVLHLYWLWSSSPFSRLSFSSFVILLFQEGRLVETFDAMIDGEVYICASFEKFKPLQYGHGLGAPTFKGGRVNNRFSVTWSLVPFAPLIFLGGGPIADDD